MELLDALRTTGATRDFKPDPVADDVLVRVLDTARFAPSGGNAQGWHVVVVRDAEKKRSLRDLYLPGWRDYLALGAAGLRPWAPTNDRAAEAAALANRTDMPAGPFAEHFDEIPVLLALFGKLAAFAAVDRDFERYTFAGGASIYPFAWNLLLAAHNEGLGGVITTMCIREEERVKVLLDAPADYALAAVIALGYPTKPVTRLKRAPVSSFATIDTVTGPPLA